MKIVNLHAAEYKQSNKPPTPVIELCLHGGNSFGRCVKVISPDLSELEEMKYLMEVIALENDSFNITQITSSSEQNTDKQTVEVENQPEHSNGRCHNYILAFNYTYIGSILTMPTLNQS